MPIWLRPMRQWPTGICQGDNIIARYRSDFELVPVDKVQYIDVAPSQMVGVSAGLIPFLEHDDANRALMGSNMQRQAVPLLITEPPLVGTGMEVDVAMNSSMMMRSPKKGTVTYVDANKIVINNEELPLTKFKGLNERTCQNQKPIVSVGDKVEKGTVIADGAATYNGELALGRNVLVGFMAWDGFNFEDAIIISEELVQNDVYTSIHIEEFDIEIRETKLGREEFTRDIPNVSEKALRNLDDTGIVRVGTYVRPGDILVGKVSPKSKTELTPEEKLLHAIFGRAGEDVKNDSLEVPSGVEGIVIHTREVLAPDESVGRRTQEVRKGFENGRDRRQCENCRSVRRDDQRDGNDLAQDADRSEGAPLVRDQEHKFVAEQAANFKLESIDIRSPERQGRDRKGSQDSVAGGGDGDRRSRSQAEQHEARRRTAQRRAANGQGLHRREASDFGRRQDGRSAR